MTRWNQPRWVVMENWITKNNPAKITNHTLAKSLNIPTWEASALINAYLGAQRSGKTKAQYALKRDGRTRAAVWSVGHESADFDALKKTIREDIEVKINGAARLDMGHMASLNPQLQRKVTLTLNAIDSAITLLGVALDPN